jgi:hypothetical protein
VLLKLLTASSRALLLAGSLREEDMECLMSTLILVRVVIDSRRRLLASGDRNRHDGPTTQGSRSLKMRAAGWAWAKRSPEYAST